MPQRPLFLLRQATAAALICIACGAAPAIAESDPATAPQPHATVAQLTQDIRVGDIIFIHAKALPFQKVSEATNSWANHVGVVIDTAGPEPIIAESTFPRSKTTPLAQFVARSENGRVAISRLNTPVSEEDAQEISKASTKRLGIYYDTGFNLHSRKQFCSRFVHEVIAEAKGIQLGEVETFQTLLHRNPNASLGFWRVWYFGNIPWTRETVTPASILASPSLHAVFDGVVEGEDGVVEASSAVEYVGGWGAIRHACDYAAL